MKLKLKDLSEYYKQFDLRTIHRGPYHINLMVGHRTRYVDVIVYCNGKSEIKESFRRKDTVPTISDVISFIDSQFYTVKEYMNALYKSQI